MSSRRSSNSPAGQASDDWSRCRPSTPTTTSRVSRHASPRRPRSGSRATRRRLGSGVGEPAADRVRQQFHRHVGTARDLRSGDVVSGPYASASTAPIVDADISAVAVHALLRDDLLGRKVPLTGPQALTNAELVGVIGDVLGRRLQLSARCHAELGASALRRPRVPWQSSPTGTPRCSRRRWPKPALVTHEVEKVLGRPAQHLRRRGRRSPATLFIELVEATDTCQNMRAPRYLKPMNRVVRAMQRLGVRDGARR